MSWKIEGERLVRDYVFADFVAAVAFVDAVAEVAEAQRHHPDIHLYDYNKVRLEITTHEAGALTARDHALAAAIDLLPS